VRVFRCWRLFDARQRLPITSSSEKFGAWRRPCDPSSPGRYHMLEFDDQAQGPKIKVIGVGGGGGNALNTHD